MVTLRNTTLLMSSLALLMTVGCAERHKAIPDSARLVAEDQGRVEFVAPSDGEVYVEDNSADKLLYSGKIDEGERLEVDPKKDRLTIDGRMVRDQRIRDLNSFRVFFKPDPRADVAGARTVVVPAEPARPARSGESEIIIQPRRTEEGDTIRVKPAEEGETIRVKPAAEGDTIRVKPGEGSDSKVTVEPGDDGSKVTIEPK